VFERRSPVTAKVSFSFEGRPLVANEGDTVAAALLAAGIFALRNSPVSGRPRAPYCMMGVCFECVVVIDGRSSHQACMTVVAEGMRIERQHRPTTP
jgi:predicted molibdopterin-dependent oxidoreductase YjgC